MPGFDGSTQVPPGATKQYSLWEDFKHWIVYKWIAIGNPGAETAVYIDKTSEEFMRKSKFVGFAILVILATWLLSKWKNLIN